MLLEVERGNACPGDSEQELQLFHVVKKTPGYEDVTNISDALEIYRNQESRHVFNALILAKATDGEISEALDVPEFILPVYRWLFFDRSQFLHSIDIAAFIERVPYTYRNFYQCACTQGPRVLAARFRVGTPPRVPVEDHQYELANGYMECFRQHRGHPLTSPIAQAALKAGMNAATVLNNLSTKAPNEDPKDGVGNLVAAIEKRDQTQSAEELGLGPSDFVS